jgi:hypothetical protein
MRIVGSSHLKSQRVLWPPRYSSPLVVTPRLLQNGVSENFEFLHDIMTSLELRFGNIIYIYIYIYPTDIELNNTSELLTEVPQKR